MDQLSRFLDRGVQRLLDRVTLAAPEAAPLPESPLGIHSTVDVRAILRGRFGGK